VQSIHSFWFSLVLPVAWFAKVLKMLLGWLQSIHFKEDKAEPIWPGLILYCFYFTGLSETATLLLRLLFLRPKSLFFNMLRSFSVGFED
jgi:hypothetical protein